MNILITGASGLIGSSLVEYLFGQGHSFFSLQRTKDHSGSFWQLDRAREAAAKQPFDAVIHLAGENIATGRWTRKKKQRILDSRVTGTSELAAFSASLDPAPQLFFSASAIGFYGSRGDRLLDERSSPGSNFVSQVCQRWEEATSAVQQANIRTVMGRIGMVLTGKGGTLTTMLPSFKLGVAGIVGPGTQYLSWVSLKDVQAMVEFVLTHEALSGPVNFVAPQPVTNHEFTKTLGGLLKKPTVMKMPAFVARTVFGQMADELILASTRVMPRELDLNGYAFHHADLKETLEDCLAETS